MTVCEEDGKWQYAILWCRIRWKSLLKTLNYEINLVFWRKKKQQAADMPLIIRYAALFLGKNRRVFNEKTTRHLDVMHLQHTHKHLCWWFWCVFVCQCFVQMQSNKLTDADCLYIYCTKMSLVKRELVFK